MGVPAGDVVDILASHAVGAHDDVLEDAVEGVADMEVAVGVDGAVMEDEGGAALGGGAGAGPEVDAVPAGEEAGARASGGRRAWGRWWWGGRRGIWRRSWRAFRAAGFGGGGGLGPGPGLAGRGGNSRGAERGGHGWVLGYWGGWVKRWWEVRLGGGCLGLRPSPRPSPAGGRGRRG